MKMRTIICILTAFLFMNANAIEKTENKEDKNKYVLTITQTPQSLLKSKKWNIMGKSIDIYFEYTNDEQLVYIDGSIVGRKKYYISDTNCFNQPYDNTKVGQINSGRFLKNEDGCYYITVIDESTIQISYLNNANPHTTTLIAKP